MACCDYHNDMCQSKRSVTSHGVANCWRRGSVDRWPLSRMGQPSIVAIGKWEGGWRPLDDILKLRMAVWLQATVRARGLGWTLLLPVTHSYVVT